MVPVAHNILFAIADATLRMVLEDVLRQDAPLYQYQCVATATEVLRIVAKGGVQCLVMSQELALHGDDGRTGLVDQLPPTLPTITFIRPGTGYPEYLYRPDQFHSWCVLPFSLDELFGQIDRVLRRAGYTI